MRYIMNRKETEINENKRKKFETWKTIKKLFFFLFFFFFFSCGELMSSCRYKIIIRCYKSDCNFGYWITIEVILYVVESMLDLQYRYIMFFCSLNWIWRYSLRWSQCDDRRAFVWFSELKIEDQRHKL
jgi:hypothetical protein